MSHKEEMLKRFDAIYVVDFETTVQEDVENQTETSVWMATAKRLWSDEQHVFSEIKPALTMLRKAGQNVLAYWHNLSFDGEFLLSYLIGELGFVNALKSDGTFLPDYDLKSGMVKYLIAGNGQWYCIKIKVGNTLINIWDSLKIIPFTVEDAAIKFRTKLRKGSIDYVGDRTPGGTITDEERDYGMADVLIIAEIMEQAIEFGATEMTIGSACEKEFKRIIGLQEYRRLFPDLKLFKLDKDIFGFDNQFDFCAAANGGGWVYLHKPGIHGDAKYTKTVGNESRKYAGIKIDGSSHYSAVEHSSSGNLYPYGKGTPFVGKIPNEALADDKYYFVRVKTRFQLKKDHLPAIASRRSLLYPGKEWLTTSDVTIGGKQYSYYKDNNGNIVPARADLWLTKTDLQLLVSQYDISDFEIIGGLYFNAKKGIFDEYINKFYEIKKNAKTPGERMLSKLFLNNLHGKFQSKEYAGVKRFKGVNDDGILVMDSEVSSTKRRGYMAAGAAVTAYGRYKTVMIAQQNYDHFIYADTDGADFSCSIEQIKGVDIHDTDLGSWKLELMWEEANFVKNKTYVQKAVYSPSEGFSSRYKVTCAGLPRKGRRATEMALSEGHVSDADAKKYGFNESTVKMINSNFKIGDFGQGLTLQGKLVPKRIKGGIVLIEEDFTIH